MAAGEGQRRPLRICMVHQSDFAIDSRIQREARALAERGDEVDCVCLSEPAIIPVGEGVIRLHPAGDRKPSGSTGAYVRGYASFFLSALRRVTRLDKARRFDLVEVHNMPDFLTLTAVRPKLRGAPVVLNIHDTFPELLAVMFGLGMDHPVVRLVKGKERGSAALADALIFVTDEAREHLGARGVGNGNAHVVMNSPDESVFGPRRAPVEVPWSGPIRVVYHGGTAERFGVECLIDAFGELATALPQAHLEIYGSGSDSAALAERAATVAPGAIEVAPSPVPFEQIPDRLAGAHIGVVPTLRNEFTELLLPVKLLEYVHMGIPVVTSRLPVIERYFSDREVRFFEPGSPASLAEAVRDVADNPQAALRRAERAGERLEEFSWQRQRERYTALVDGLVPPRAAPPRKPVLSVR